jgi:hypothetical protein
MDLVNRKARHHSVEAAEVGHRFGEVMANELHAPLTRKPLACGLQHRLGDVEPHADAVGSVQPQQSEQTSITRADVEDPPDVVRHVIEQDTSPSVRCGEHIRSGEVAERMLWVLHLLTEPSTIGGL